MLRPAGVPKIPAATAALARRVHPHGTDEMRVRDALGPLFEDEDFTTGEFQDMSPRLGQPGLSPALLAMVTILQFLHNLSDREAAQALADRISEEIRPGAWSWTTPALTPRCCASSAPG